MESESDNKVLSSDESFFNLSGGETAEWVRNIIGDPDDKLKHEGNFFSDRPPYITYYYKGLGKIQFYFRDVKEIYIGKLIPYVRLTDSIERLQLQLGLEGESLREVARRYYTFSSVSTDKLDKIANKLWQDKDAEGYYTIDALSWFCKVIANSRDPRYRTLLHRIINESSSKKLRKYAENSLQMLPGDEVTQFIPKNI